MKNLVWLLVFISTSTFAQEHQKPSLQIGFGSHSDRITGYAHDVDTISIGGESRKDHGRPSIFIFYNHPISSRLNIEAGLKVLNTYYGYFTGQYRSPFGYVYKGGTVRSNTLNVPLNLEWSFKRFFYLKGGGMATFGKYSEHLYGDFTDTPAVNEHYNKVQDTMKPNFLSVGAGAGFRWKNFDVSYYLSKSATRLSEPMEIDGQRYQLFDHLVTHHFELSYHLTFKRHQ